MAKYRGGGGMPNMANLMQQAQKMQEQVKKTQLEIDEMEFTATAGGGAVTVMITGNKVFRDIKIAPEAIDPDDTEMLCDMLLVACNDALKQADETANEKLSAVTGGMNLPGM